MKNIIEHTNFQASLKKIAVKQKMDLAEVKKKGEEYIKELYTNQHPIVNMMSLKGYQYMLTKAYNNKIDVDPEDIKKLMILMRQNSVAFIMTHKTYLDTIVLITTLASYGMPIPYMFGGVNLAFPGMKQVGKNAGLIFIRRSFKDDLIYKAALGHYISTLIDNGKHLTWNIEGTRSRTGKIVYPQMGILKYIMEAEKQSSKPIKYIPVSIVYDLIPDVKEMTEEGKGNRKKSEDLIEFVNYIKKLGNQYGKAAIRFGDPVEVNEEHSAIIPELEEDSYSNKNTLPRFAFELIHKANMITPVTTVSLVCNVLLNNFALTKKELEISVVKLMNLIGQRKEDVLIDRGNNISATMQRTLNLLHGAGIVQKSNAGLKVQYNLSANEYLSATYYANMASGHLYHRAFIEMALVKIKDDKSSKRIILFWKEIMNLRNLFKFEFFYTNKAKFSVEIEDELALFDKNWRDIISNPKEDISHLLSKQEIFVSKAILLTYLEANKVVGHALNTWNLEDEFIEDEFLDYCMFKGKELHWQSRINRIDIISKPFLLNALRLAINTKLTPENKKINYKKIENWLELQDDLIDRLNFLQNLEIKTEKQNKIKLLSVNEVIPGAELNKIPEENLQQEEGPHIAAFFDLDRTIINDFSAKKFLQTRLLSGQSTSKELLSHFASIAIYASGSRDFEVITKISSLGVKGIKESEFIAVGEEVYSTYLSDTIYPESRVLITSHLEKGHKIVLVSAATAYQVNPIAKELGIKDVFCTKLEIRKGKFTGNIEAMCWGEGKAKAGKIYAKSNKIDLSKSFFYTDSIDDLPLLEIVGNPVATNPDNKLSQLAFENNWPILRFDETIEKPVINGFRTGLAIASLYPSVIKGLATGIFSMSKQKGINATLSSIGDLGAKFSGLDIAIKGKQNLVDFRPAVFCFNHQSTADMIIIMKLLREDFTGIAKKELEYTPIGPFFKALGAIYIERADKLQAIKAMEPAVDALKNGISIAIAPEGTRSGSKKLGAFKKGAFHLAIKAGVPIIPIVIKNAYLATSEKGGNLLKPTHIEVVVLNPVDTSEWRVKKINKYVEEVRNLFLKELEN